MDIAKKMKILCVSTTGMGNAILYIPVIRTLAKNYPDATIDFIVSYSAAESLLQGYSGIRKLIFLPKDKIGIWDTFRLIKTLRNEKYDLFVSSFLDKSMKVALFSYLLGIPKRVGFSNGWWKIFYNHRVSIKEHKHEVEYNLDLLKKIGLENIDNSISIELSNIELSFGEQFLTDSNIDRKKHIIGIHPGSGTNILKDIKRWPVEKYAELANELTQDMNSEIIIFGGKEELPLSEKMVSYMHIKPIIATGRTSIHQTAALIKMCDVFICNDSGLMHIAASLKTPIAAIFGPTLYWKNYPWQVNHKIIRKQMKCSPCYEFRTINCPNPKCLDDISVEEVKDAVKKILDGQSGGRIGAIDVKSVIDKTAPNQNQRKYKVSIITPDFSHNCVGRAYFIADLLGQDFSVEIIGAAFEAKVWPPIVDKPPNVEYKYIPMTKQQFFCGKFFEIAKLVSGDVIIISKSVLPSLCIGIIAKFSKRIPLIIDIDDWELGFEIDRFQNTKFFGKKILSLLWVLKLWLCELTAKKINRKIVSNLYLHNKFKGLILPHVRDTTYLNPEKYSKKQLREIYGIASNAKIVLFLGTPREHKGIRDLFSAFRKINNREALLMIVGFNLNDPNQKRLNDEISSVLGEQCRLYPQQAFKKIPEFLAMSDIVVVPQTKCYSSLGQIPAKLFDAMAMGKPIIASRINDIPVILQSCGLIYEPGDTEELSKLIADLFDNQNKLSQLGNKAREICIEKYSYEAARPLLREYILQTIMEAKTAN